MSDTSTKEKAITLVNKFINEANLDKEQIIKSDKATSPGAVMQILNGHKDVTIALADAAAKQVRKMKVYYETEPVKALLRNQPAAGAAKEEDEDESNVQGGMEGTGGDDDEGTDDEGGGGGGDKEGGEKAAKEKVVGRSMEEMLKEKAVGRSMEESGGGVVVANPLSIPLGLGGDGTKRKEQALINIKAWAKAVWIADSGAGAKKRAAKERERGTRNVISKLIILEGPEKGDDYTIAFIYDQAREFGGKTKHYVNYANLTSRLFASKKPQHKILLKKNESSSGDDAKDFIIIDEFMVAEDLAKKHFIMDSINAIFHPNNVREAGISKELPPPVKFGAVPAAMSAVKQDGGGQKRRTQKSRRGQKHRTHKRIHHKKRVTNRRYATKQRKKRRTRRA